MIKTVSTETKAFQKKHMLQVHKSTIAITNIGERGTYATTA